MYRYGPERDTAGGTRLAACLVALSLALLPAVGAARDLAAPAPFTAVFDLAAWGMTIGETTWRLSRDADGFTYVSQSKPTGLFALIKRESVRESSRWRYVGGEARPVVYRYVRRGKKRRDLVMHFDWSKGIARTTEHGTTRSMHVPPGTLDKLGYVLALMRDLAAGRRQVSYTIADGEKLKTYAFRVIGEQRMRTALGSFHTLHVVRERHSTKRSTSIWCAPALGFLPVRVEHHETHGDDVTLTLRKVSGRGG